MAEVMVSRIERSQANVTNDVKRQAEVVCGVSLTLTPLCLSGCGACATGT